MTKEQFPRNEVLRMDQAVQYSGNSIVSRQVIRSAGGNVSLFAFDQDQELSEHTAPFDALVQVLEGKAEIIIAGVKHTLVLGSSILMPAGIPHAVRAVEPFKMLLTMIKSPEQ